MCVMYVCDVYGWCMCVMYVVYLVWCMCVVYVVWCMCVVWCIWCGVYGWCMCVVYMCDVCGVVYVGGV